MFPRLLWNARLVVDPQDAALHNAFFGNGEKFSELFPTRDEREAFLQTDEYQQISRLRESLCGREAEKVAQE